jgi:hypothetical protein
MKLTLQIGTSRLRIIVVEVGQVEERMALAGKLEQFQSQHLFLHQGMRSLSRVHGTNGTSDQSRCFFALVWGKVPLNLINKVPVP